MAQWGKLILQEEDKIMPAPVNYPVAPEIQHLMPALWAADVVSAFDWLQGKFSFPFLQIFTADCADFNEILIKTL